MLGHPAISNHVEHACALDPDDRGLNVHACKKALQTLVAQRTSQAKSYAVTHDLNRYRPLKSLSAYSRARAVRWRNHQNRDIAFREAKRSAAMDLTPIQETERPQKAKPLTDEEEEIARLMVFGLPTAEFILGEQVRPNWPLDLEQAASAIGYRLKRARQYLNTKPEFRAYLRELVMGFRKSEEARGIKTAITIRDDEGDNSAATKTVRLKAIQVIEGTSDKASVTVNVNQQTNVATIQPGYVIRLPAGAPMPLTIDQAPEPITSEARE